MPLEVIVLDLDIIASKLRAVHDILDISIEAKTGSKEAGKMVPLIYTHNTASNAGYQQSICLYSSRHSMNTSGP